MIARGRTDLNFSFVTNGTVFNENLLNKLKQFNRVGIEVSIETVTEHNAYQRQGTDTALVLEAGQTIQGSSDTADKVTVTVTGWEREL
jgi:sulfatase maturation enzyme AslB (radical SAM superfamily)